MCGISGFFDRSFNLNSTTLQKYCEVLKHRGPNDNGIYENNFTTGKLGFAHTRLSILDLSPLGHQPMIFENWVIVLNGEIYNFKEIRNQLINKGYTFTSESDTEVVLKAFDCWGMDCVQQFIGMFAFAIADTQNQNIYLCRDRAGVKPLYYYFDHEKLVFGSEMKVFFQTENIQKNISTSGLYQFLQYGYVKGPNTIVENINKLEPGTWLVYNTNNNTITNTTYWNITEHYKKPKFNGSFTDAVNEGETLIKSACNYRMVADVPVGIFLSGGFDSSMVTALLQKDRTQKLKTFTIGFPDGVDESKDAKKIAAHLGTDHTSYDCSYSDAKEIIPQLPFFYDEPIGDISAIPTMLVSKLARKEVTVALSADGGDELFGGYPGYKHSISRMQKINKIPFAPITSTILNITGNLIQSNNPWLSKKLLGIGNVLKYKNERQFVELNKHVNGLPNGTINNIIKHKQLTETKSNFSNLTNVVDSLFVLDFEQTLRDYLLIKVDRATMAYSLEGREPLLDHRLIEFSAQLPFDYKIDQFNNKKIIKEIVYKYLPKELMDRPKVGFDLPIFDWLKTDLKYLLDEYLSESNLNKSDLFNTKQIIQMKNLFLANQLKEKDLIWRLLVFQMWYTKWIKN